MYINLSAIVLSLQILLIPEAPLILICFQRQPQRRQRGRTTHQVKRQRTDSVQPAATPSIPQQPKERPDANHHLKFTYGVSFIQYYYIDASNE